MYSACILDVEQRFKISGFASSEDASMRIIFAIDGPANIYCEKNTCKRAMTQCKKDLFTMTGVKNPI